MDRDRIDDLRASLPFWTWYSRSPHQTGAEQEGAIDLLFGNPHDMPVPGLVETIRRHGEPRDPSWFAYMLDHQPAQEAVAALLREHTGLGWAPEDVALTTGGFGALAVAIRMLTEPGDEVVYYDPPWFFYNMLVRAAEAVPIVLRLEPPRFSPDPQRLADAITPRTRAVILNTPHNPSGRVLDAAELAAVADVLREASARHGRPIHLLADEAYRPIVLDGRRAASPSEHYEHTIVLYSFGKQILAPGHRLGYLALSPRIPGDERAALREAATLVRFAHGWTFPGNDLQRALPDLQRLCIDVGAIERRRDRLVPVLAEHGLEPTHPEGTFYVLARSPDPDDLAFVDRMAAERLYILPGAILNLPGWFRISLTASDAMVEQAAERFARVPAAAR